MSKNNLLEIAKLVRYWSVKLPTIAGSGHPSSSTSAVELMTALMFGGFFKYNIECPENINNDHLIFSKGHASSLFYSLWHAAGVIKEKDLVTYRQFNSVLEGHPTRRFEFTEAATGSLGQGLAIGLGKAMASKINKLTNKTFVLMGDSELAEGSVWEAAAIAGHYKLDNIVSVVDVNKFGQRGETMTAYNLKMIGQRFVAFGWQVIYIKDGNNINEVEKAYKALFSKKQTKPTVIIAKTVKGFGIKGVAGKQGWHGKPLNLDEWKKIESDLLPKRMLVKAEIAKTKKIINLSKKNKFNIKSKNFKETLPTRFAIGEALASLAANETLVFIDAEVGNSTGLDKAKLIAGDRYIQSYIAEQTMVGLATGLSLSGKKAVIATFGAFFSRAFDQLRMAAYNQANLTCIGTHAGVAIGEDGVSQMALEDVAMFRSLFNSVVLQPADDISARQITALALNHQGLSYVRALRQVCPRIYSNKATFTIGGLNVINNFKQTEAVVLASGTTVAEAVKAQSILKEQGVNIGVVDVYCLKPLPEKRLNEILSKAGKIVIVEDHYQAGGMGEAIMASATAQTKKIKHLFVNVMPRSGSSDELLNFSGVNFEAIIKAVKS